MLIQSRWFELEARRWSLYIRVGRMGLCEVFFCLGGFFSFDLFNAKESLTPASSR